MAIPLRIVRLVAWALVGVALFVVVALSLGFFRSGGPGGETTAVGTIGGAFTATNTKGEPVSEKTFLGKPTVYFFGFTHCPEICPTALFDMTNRLKALGPDADRFNVVFVTVDPARDTTKVLADYLTAFDPRIVGLVGTQAETDALVSAFRVYVKKGEPDPKTGDYTVDHTAAFYVMNAKGQFILPIQYSDDDEAAIAKMRRALQS